MRKYTKPEIEIISFEVESSIMAAVATPTPVPAESTRSSVISSTQYVPDSVDKKVWATVDDGENWNWE